MDYYGGSFIGKSFDRIVLITLTFPDVLAYPSRVTFSQRKRKAINFHDSKPEIL